MAIHTGKGPVGADAQGKEKPDNAREVGKVRMEQSVAEMDNLMNGTITELFQRKSVRAFGPLPIDPAIRDLLFEAALQAPTAGNQTLYTILDITDPVLKAELGLSSAITSPSLPQRLWCSSSWQMVDVGSGCTARQDASPDRKAQATPCWRWRTL
jgi:hypothetical protein